MKRLSLVLAAAALAAPIHAADVYTVDKAHSNVNFAVRHTMTKVSGRFTDFDGTFNIDKAKPEASSVEFTIKAASIDTGNADRDKHLRNADFFDVEKFPEISFKSAAVKPTGKDTYDVKGTFTMHGVAKEITLPITVLGEGKDGRGNAKIGFETKTTVNRKDHGIVWNRALDTGGFVLGDDVAVDINIQATKKADPAAKS
jgi:polyisoprenoid-binding protein YceI